MSRFKSAPELNLGGMRSVEPRGSVDALIKTFG